MLGLLEGFAGYSLPDDLLSGIGLRIVAGIVEGIPVVGTYLTFFIFGGEFPGTAFIPRLYIVHVLLFPAHPARAGQRSPDPDLLPEAHPVPGPGPDRNNVVGYPLFPVYTAKAGGFFFIVFGVTP